MNITVLVAGVDGALAAKLRESGGIDVVAETDNVCGLFDLLPRHAPDILIIGPGIGRAERSGITEELTKFYGDSIRVIAVAGDSDMDLFSDCIRHGYRGFLLESCPFGEVLSAVAAVYSGVVFVCPHVSGDMVRDIVATSPPIDRALLETLTDREIDVLRLIKKGKTAKEISAECFISEGTAHQHIKHIMKKLEVHAMIELHRRLILTRIERQT